jgi:hypothetical protein
MSKLNTADERVAPGANRKFFCDQIDDLCSKKKKTEEDCSNTDTGSLEDIFKQGSDRTNCMDLNLDFSESIPLTEPEYKHISDTENDCGDNFSWLINFNVGTLFHAVKVDRDRNHKGRKDEEIACQVCAINLQIIL